MRKIFTIILAFSLFLTNSVYSADLEGDLILYDRFGTQVIPPGTVPITGIVDLANDVLIIDPFSFFTLPMITNVLEILPPGSYTRIGSFGEVLNATIPPGNEGAYMELEWNDTVFSMFMGWEINADKTAYTPIDVDGDGVPGMRMLAGPFIDLSAVYEFTAEPSGPGVRLDLVVVGGDTQECTDTGGTTATLTALTTLFGGAELASVDWTVDGVSAGSGDTITPFLTLGAHTVEALATTTTGESDSDSLVINVVDTMPPIVDARFLDSRTGEPISSITGNRAHFVTTSFGAMDVCDPEPQTQGTVTPTFGVNDGDTIKIQGNNQTVNLPTTVLELFVTATDASGNIGDGRAVLSISD